VVLVAVLAGLFLYYHDRESTDDAQVDGHITPISSKIFGRVAQVLVDDNQPVKAGQVLVKIDPRDYQASVDQAKAALALAESDARSAGVDVPRTRENVESGTSSADAQLAGSQAALASAQVTYDQAQTSDLAWAQANIDKSQANALLAQADLARYKPLLDKGEISQQQYDAAKANADATASALKADQEKLAQAQRNVDITHAQFLAAQARVEQAKAGVAAARADTKQVSMRTADAQGKIAKVAQAQAALEAAQLNLSYTDVVAPVDGVVTHKQVEPGQVVQQGQGLLVVVPLKDV
jgi:membrane fusion protein (multidrug efflux system)